MIIIFEWILSQFFPLSIQKCHFLFNILQSKRILLSDVFNKDILSNSCLIFERPDLIWMYCCHSSILIEVLLMWIFLSILALEFSSSSGNLELQE